MGNQSRKRRMRCPRCRSLSVVRNGSRQLVTVSIERHVVRRVQCYHCSACGEYFSCRREKGKKYSFGFRAEVARMHVEERMSYRVISKRLQEKTGKEIAPTVLCRMVHEVARHSKSSWEIQREYQPQWTGYLTVDDKYLHCKRERIMSLVAIDASGDAIHSEVLTDPSQESIEQFLQYIRDRLEYPIKGITTDLDERLHRAIERVFTGEIRHQRCIWHALESIRKEIGYGASARRKGILERQLQRLDDLQRQWMSLEERERVSRELEAVCVQHEQQRALLWNIRQMLYANDIQETRQRFQKLRRQYGKSYPVVIRFLKTHGMALTMHQQDPHLEKTSNRAENFNRQLQRRFKTIESFQTSESAADYLNLLRNYLRFKPFTDCRVDARGRNGKAPIELCGVKLQHHNWLKHAINWS
jgi:transposase-like protein